MKLREEFRVAQPVASVWEFFERPESVAGCVPGVEALTVVTPDEIDVRLTQSVGPMTATFAAKVAITERVPEKLIAFTATGKTVRGAMGNVRAGVSVELEPVGDATVVIVEGDVALAGALGSVGQKVVAKQAGKVTGQFARNLEAALSGSAAPAAQQPTRAAEPGAAPVARTLPPVGEQTPAAGDPWAKVAAALSAVSVVLGVVALRRTRRRGRR